ncbi:hypothetical protein [Cupriavidus necator]
MAATTSLVRDDAAMANKAIEVGERAQQATAQAARNHQVIARTSPACRLGDNADRVGLMTDYVTPSQLT